MTQIFEGKCITNRHRIFACVYDVDFLEEWKEGGIFFKTPCSSPRAWLSVTLVCYIVHRTQWSIFEISIRKLLGKFKVCFVTHMVLRTWECIKKDIAQNCWKLFDKCIYSSMLHLLVWMLDDMVAARMAKQNIQKASVPLDSVPRVIWQFYEVAQSQDGPIERSLLTTWNKVFTRFCFPFSICRVWKSHWFVG